MDVCEVPDGPRRAQDPDGAASSFVEEGPSSFAEADAKLQALREQTDAALARVSAAPSSFLQEDPSIGRDWDKKFRARPAPRTRAVHWMRRATFAAMSRKRLKSLRVPCVAFQSPFRFAAPRPCYFRASKGLSLT